jgi:hypothetical protein
MDGCVLHITATLERKTIGSVPCQGHHMIVCIIFEKSLLVPVALTAIAAVPLQQSAGGLLQLTV